MPGTIDSLHSASGTHWQPLHFFLPMKQKPCAVNFTDDVSRQPFGVGRHTYRGEFHRFLIFNPYHSYARLEYEATSLLPSPLPADVRQASTVYPDEIRDTYLRLHARNLITRIPELATTNHREPIPIPFGQRAPSKAIYVSHFGYTLDLKRPAAERSAGHFLFQRRAGHCEYFAAAMTVMLRTQGIPARYINGFQMGSSAMSREIVVRESDAHSWVEAYFPGFGWLTFDPTPPSGGKNAHRDFFRSFRITGIGSSCSGASGSSTTTTSFTRLRYQNLGRFSRDWAERLQTDFASKRNQALKN